MRKDHTIIYLVLAIVALMGAMGVIVYFGTQPSHSTIVAPDGKSAVLVECSSAGDCLRESAAVCPRGYSVEHQSAERGQATVFVGNAPKGGVATGIGVPTETYSGSMLIRCRP